MKKEFATAMFKEGEQISEGFVMAENEHEAYEETLKLCSPDERKEIAEGKIILTVSDSN